MPNWKKLLVSGSDAALNSLNVTTDVTASFFTGSFIGDGSQLTNLPISELTGYTVGPNTPIAATDTLLEAFGKTQGQIDTKISGSIAAGQVAFGTATNIIEGDNGLFWDNINKRLGIGTITPSSKLEVTGNVAIGYTSAAPTNGLIVAGNVGIGNNSPIYKADIIGESGNYALRVGQGNSNISGANTGIKFTLSTNLSTTLGSSIKSIRVNSSSALTFLGEEVERMRINEIGNVGIGTTTPGEKLEVTGNIKITNSLLSNQENLDVDSGALRVIAQIPSATYTAAFFDFVIKKGTNLRSGTVYACHDGTNVEFTETSTADLGTTEEVKLSVDISSGNFRLLATTTTNDWTIKTLVRGL